MKRAFALLALYFVRHKKSTPFLVLPNHVRVPLSYEEIFLEINCAIGRKKNVKGPRDDWS